MKINLKYFILSCMFSITVLAQVPNYVPTSSLIAWYSFNGNANDLSGNGNNGSLLNGVAATTDRFANSNSAYSFDGIDDRIYVSNNFFNNGWNEFTVSGWTYLYTIPNPNGPNSSHCFFNS